MTPHVTWRMVALCLGVLLLGMIASRLVRDSAVVLERDAAVAAATIAKDSARAGLLAAKASRQIADSLAHVIATLPRPSKTRQRTDTVLVDIADSVGMAQLLATIVAERDTALADAALLSESLTKAQELAESMRVAARLHAAADSARYASIETAADDVVRAVRPPWYRRLSRVAGRGAQVAGVAVIAFTLGRAT